MEKEKKLFCDVSVSCGQNDSPGLAVLNCVRVGWALKKSSANNAFWEGFGAKNKRPSFEL